MSIRSRIHLSPDSSSLERLQIRLRPRWVSMITLVALVMMVAPQGAQAGLRSPGELAGRFSTIYFFGDSWSDAGNFAAGLPVDEIPQAAPGQDSSFYWENRFTNGPNWADQMAKALGHSVTASLLGGSNYARGAAANVSPSPHPAFALVHGVTGWLLSEQVGEHLSSASPGDPEALYVIYMGTNDFPVGGAVDPVPGVAEVARAISDLHAAGSRQFFVMNLFPFVVPGFDGVTAYANGFNELLPSALDALEDSLDDIVITRGNNVAALGPVLADPAAFGFTNAGGFFEPTACTVIGYPGPPVGGDSACEAEALTDTFFGRPIGETFLFHDAVHFTSAVQSFWADHAVAELCKTRIRQHFPGRFGERIAKFLCER